MEDLSDVVFESPEGEQYVYVTGGEGDPVTLWSYALDRGFLAVEERPRSALDGWERVEALPEAILERVSGEEVPIEEY